MGNKKKALDSTTLVESSVVYHQSNEPKIVLDKNGFVSVEAQMFHDKLALIASPYLERGIDFYGPGNDKITTLTALSEVHCAFLFEISDRTCSKISSDEPITGPWMHLSLKKHDKSLQDLIAKHQHRAEAEHVVALDLHSNSQQGTWEPPPPVHPNYVFHRSHTEAELRSLAIYHSRSLHAFHHKLNILAHQLHHVQPLNMESWPSELDASSWHFGPPNDDEFGPGYEESKDEYTNHAEDDGVGSSGHS
ncbi:hypothetical protein ACH5RR_004343 [Cinchona calisaya]|uniref:Uncharacterized protein n=1 Tax=Cinchona calisaya TaxID=153742 RepID=A0ABD3AXA0_9GENT